MRGLIVSPHLDDAVLSMGGTIGAGSTVLTVLAGFPPAWHWPTPFDNASGFDDSVKAVEAHRLEDQDACAELGARAEHRGFLDGQYGRPPEFTHLSDNLGDAIRRHRRLAVPLGLAHPDHRLVASACRTALHEVGPRRWIVYADLPAAHLWPEQEEAALGQWELDGYDLEPLCWSIDLDRKRAAVDRYVSQRRFPELAFDNLTEEHGWMAHRAG